MKGSFEFAFIMTFIMMFLVIGMGFIRIMIQFQDAKMVQERVIAHLEVMDHFDNNSLSSLALTHQCDLCEVIYDFDALNRITVTVIFPVRIPILDWEIQSRVIAKTIPLF